ncbi:electron transfer flavoprotein subunit alpha, mitochondrial [Typha angustifolia]|uniref:electron transfer flavoprotein subunit alpha, mitochondrial n=1 Tax=Typha angustifolia TaxID=59011 RepID=UPI003C2B9E18
MAVVATLRALRNRSISSFAHRSVNRFISTLVIAEHEGGFVKPSSLSALAAAEAITKENSVSVLLGGSGSTLQKAASHAASSHPLISEVLVADLDILEHPLAESWAELVHSIQRKGGYSHIVSASTSFGKNVIPRAAALLDVSPITDVISIAEPRVFVRPIYAGNALCTVRYTGQDPCIMTVRSTSFPYHINLTDAEPRSAPITQVDLSFFSEETLGKSRYLTLASQDTERPDLGNARVVVTGGRALKSTENFKMLERLAEKLGAAVGATRAAVDAGFVPNDLQVGQTGKIVAPELYMAFGVSGAIQHLAGMRDSKVIVAVNKDGDAPIFQVADYGLVADLFEVIPELLEKLPEEK